jgi:DNA polymerase-3 subunit delta'
MENWGMIGHEWAVELLKGHLRRGAPRHAYLFTGPRNVGRRTLALRFAQAINAEAPTAPGEYDPDTRTSLQFEGMQHPDLSIIERQEGDKDIKIEAIRELQQSLALTPYSAKYRIALLLNFEDANPNSANALLKTLEEPNRRVVIIMTAESAEVLLPTISSRCEIVRLRPVPLDDVAAGLQTRWDIPSGQAKLLAHLSNGRPGYAVKLDQEPEHLALRVAWLDEQRQLISDGRVARFKYAADISKDKEQFREVLQVWLSYWRDMLMYTARADTPIINLDRVEEIGDLSVHLDVDAARSTLAAIENTIGLLQTNVNLRLAAENLLLELPYI